MKRTPTRLSKKLAREYATVRAAAEDAERRGDAAEAQRLAREYQQLHNQILAIGRERARRSTVA